MRKSLYTGLVIIIGLVLIDAVNAATIWVNPINTGTQDGLMKATGYKDLWKAMSIMSSGDTVIIADGDWRTYSNMNIINNAVLPPSGTSLSNMTTIRAETDWGVKLLTIVDNGTGRDYVMIRGIVFYGYINGYNYNAILYHWNYSKIIRCGFFSEKVSGNILTFCIYGGHYNLVEECIAWGGGRYTFCDYHGDHNIFRRCVARHDWYISPDWKGQECNFRGYGSSYDTYQNCISIDSDRIEYQTPDGTSIEDADFWTGDQDGGDHNVFAGCIAMKGFYMAYYFGGYNQVVTMDNCIALGPSLEGVSEVTGAIILGNAILTASNCLFYDFDKGVQRLAAINKPDGNLSLSNSIIRDVGALVGNADYIYYYNVTTGNYGSHSTNANPFTNGLLYPVRIEAGFPLATAGSGGTVCGPTILKKIGVSGTTYGEPGWDQVTDENLWPFPNEDKIKGLMSVTVDGVSGIYGFTAYNSPFGSPNTLTSYIWEYLGNKIPPEIYNKPGQPGKPIHVDK